MLGYLEIVAYLSSLGQAIHFHVLSIQCFYFVISLHDRLSCFVNIAPTKNAQSSFLQLKKTVQRL